MKGSSLCSRANSEDATTQSEFSVSGGFVLSMGPLPKQHSGAGCWNSNRNLQKRSPSGAGEEWSIPEWRELEKGFPDSGYKTTQVSGSSWWGGWAWSAASGAQSCPTLCDPMDCRLCGILQARILEWIAISFSRRSFPTQGIEPKSPTLQAGSPLSDPPGNPCVR